MPRTLRKVRFPSDARRTDVRETVLQSNRRRRLRDQLMEIVKLSRIRQRLGLIVDPALEEAEAIRVKPDAELLANFRRILTVAKKTTEGWGGSLYFVYLPSWSRYRNSSRPADREHQEVLNLVKALGIPVIDIQPAFQAQDDPLSLFPFRKFGHYDERGNRLVASTLVKSLSTP